MKDAEAKGGSAELIKGSSVWVANKTAKGDWPWMLGRLAADPTPEGYTVILDNGPTVVVQSCEPANPLMQEGANDLMQLTHLNEPSLLHNMQTRFEKDVIYTLAGTVLIAVNPFKTLEIYDKKTQDRYRGAAVSARMSSSSSLGSMNEPTELPPHIYGVAGDAFRSMEREGRSQSIVISGESGSGKTESTKHALKYLANLSNKLKGESAEANYEQKLLETNPILEAFGNAKTVRNDNSSRFGKLIQIHFNHKLHIVGAGMRTYLLEKSRVVRPGPKERSYHIFYQLLAGASPMERQMFHLPTDPATFEYLAKPGAELTVPGQDDSSNFEEVCQAFDVVGFDAADINAIFSLVAGVLWMGNIQFEEGDNDGARVIPGEAVQHAAELLGVSYDTLAFALTHKTIKGLGASKNLNQKMAGECRDALAKAVYASLFDWIVEKINEKLFPGAKSKGTYIGILDIFGFENFEENSFEQLCINYANEKLQQQFCRHEFNLRQQQFKEELGDSIAFIEYQDNKACIELLEGARTTPGVFTVLDSEAKMPGTRTGMQYVNNLLQACSGNNLLTGLRKDRSAFQISHFSDVVTYNANDMNSKNKDDISDDLIDLMAGSSNRILSLLGQKTKKESDGKKGLRTVGARFRQEMKELESALDATDLHFVRCIKPTDKPTPPRVNFDQKKVMDQLRSAGILTVAKLAQTGFLTQFEIQKFVTKYSSLNIKSSAAVKLLATGLTGWLESREPTKDDCIQLLQQFGISQSEFAIGKTKIFFKTGVLGRVDDQYARRKHSLELLSCALRRWQWHRWWRTMRTRVVTVQNTYRCRRAQSELKALRAEAERRRAAAERELQEKLREERMKLVAAQLAKEASIQARLKKQEEEAEALRREEAERRRRELEELERIMKQQEEEELMREAEEQERKKREAEEMERQKREAEEAERKRREAEEAERKRREAEEAERQRRQAEEAQRKRREAEELEAKRHEALERRRRQKAVEQEERVRKEAADIQRLEREQEERSLKEAEERERIKREEEQRKAAEARRLAAEQQQQQQQKRNKGAQRGYKAVPIPTKHREQTKKCLEEVVQARAAGHEHVVEVFNSFLDVSRKLGNDVQLLQEVLARGSSPGFYYDTSFEHSVLKQSLARLESRFIKYNLQRARSMLSKPGTASSLADQLHQAETIFRNWILDMQATLDAMEPYLPS